MFKCKRCAVYESEIKFLREQFKKLQDRYLALSSPQTFGMVESTIFRNDAEAYSGDEAKIVYDEFGRPITEQRKAE